MPKRRTFTQELLQEDDDVPIILQSAFQLGHDQAGLTRRQRTSLFLQLEFEPENKATLPPLRINGPDQLGRKALKECYRIVDEAIKCQPYDHKPSPEMMEQFFHCVFQSWNPENHGEWEITPLGQVLPSYRRSWTVVEFVDSFPHEPSKFYMIPQ